MTAKKKGIVFIILPAVLIVLVVIAAVLIPPFLRMQNDTLVTELFVIENEKIPAAFDGFTLALVTDLHSKEFGPSNEQLILAIQQANPDAVLVGGDTLKANDKTDSGQVFLSLCKNLTKEYPVYVVYGNHEQRRYDLSNIDFTYQREIEAAGAKVIAGQKVPIIRAGETINLYGLNLPYIFYMRPREQSLLRSFFPSDERYFKVDIQKVLGEPESGEFNILLTHNPIKFAAYADWGADLVLSGHEHGGIIRLPFYGGLLTRYASTGDMVRYDAGLFTKGSSQMIVSRGLGSAAVPYRIFNKPELVTVTLKAKQ
ncbi:metallophosphoesterase [Acetanaerobacterium elongatum]|uniref:Calcineurin-like phosphoesterase domain-containing protein n=1 Tax=Acetanaerobacterium elongatum TaxID=258515 RepID=A0A1G9VR10_9FIRM|nr:metallophosphoesterase [Acetanaerobacterium elongatum]SDM74547.1 hypothetical protein SAMN05192585_10475 [Acetanaerobacterium elongatum]